MPAAPLDPAILQQAAAWMARLWSETVTDQDRAACAAWLAANPEHQRAWQQLEVIGHKLDSVPREVAQKVLREPAGGRGRRGALRLLGMGIVAFGAIDLLRQSGPWQHATATQSTATGEIREIVLPDGSAVTLASGTALDVRFTARERAVELLAGEIFVRTAHPLPPDGRPFRVRNRHGLVEALGTRFDVRMEADASDVSVFEGEVRVSPARAPGHDVRLSAGQHCRFSANRCDAPGTAREQDETWTRAILLAEDMRVADFVAELARYRHGLLRCAPDVAELRVSGVFPLRDTDRALHNLSLVLPVTLVYRTPYWVTVQAG